MKEDNQYDIPIAVITQPILLLFQQWLIVKEHKILRCLFTNKKIKLIKREKLVFMYHEKNIPSCLIS